MSSRSSSLDFQDAPARPTFWPIGAAEPWTGLQTERLELISRGDLVSGLRIRLRRGVNTGESGSRPGLLLLVHDAAGHANAPEWSPVAHWLATNDRAVAIALDLPLHGPRSSAKLSERLVSAFAALARGAFLDRNGAVLVEEFLRQSTHDLARTLDALLAPGDLDPDRVALIGLGLGAHVADSLLEQDDRVRAAVLVRTRRAPAAKPAIPLATTPAVASASAPAARRLELETQDGERDWAAQALHFLRANAGF